MIYYLLFFTTHDVLKAEKVLKKNNVAIELVPVPRNLSSDCGMCIKFDGDISIIKTLLHPSEMDKCLSYDGKDYKSVTL